MHLLKSTLPHLLGIVLHVGDLLNGVVVLAHVLSTLVVLVLLTNASSLVNLGHIKQSTPQTNNRVQCQICSKFGHHALECWQSFNQVFQPQIQLHNFQY